MKKKNRRNEFPIDLIEGNLCQFQLSHKKQSNNNSYWRQCFEWYFVYLRWLFLCAFFYFFCEKVFSRIRIENEKTFPSREIFLNFDRDSSSKFGNVGREKHFRYLIFAHKNKFSCIKQNIPKMVRWAMMLMEADVNLIMRKLRLIFFLKKIKFAKKIKFSKKKFRFFKNHEFKRMREIQYGVKIINVNNTSEFRSNFALFTCKMMFLNFFKGIYNFSKRIFISTTHNSLFKLPNDFEKHENLLNVYFSNVNTILKKFIASIWSKSFQILHLRLSQVVSSSSNYEVQMKDKNIHKFN